MWIGTDIDKAKLMFDMHDLNGDGSLNKEDFIAMLKYTFVSIEFQII